MKIRSNKIKEIFQDRKQYVENNNKKNTFFFRKLGETQTWRNNLFRSISQIQFVQF